MPVFLCLKFGKRCGLILIWHFSQEVKIVIPNVIPKPNNQHFDDLMIL